MEERFGSQEDKEVFRRLIAFLEEYTEQKNMYWYPFCALKKEVPLAVYDLDRLYREAKIDQLADLFHHLGIMKANSFQMQSGNMRLQKKVMPDILYEKDMDGYHFPWDVETFYFDDSREWLVYVSHEGTITFTGEKIFQAAGTYLGNEYLWG